jgi:glutamyl/glutaminyl-tRNA synthetase
MLKAASKMEDNIFEMEYQYSTNKISTRVSLDFFDDGNISIETARLLTLAYLYSKNNNGKSNIYARNFHYSDNENYNKNNTNSKNLINWLLTKYKFEYNPYLQSRANLETYKKHAMRLIERGFAYCVPNQENVNEKTGFRGFQRDWKPQQVLNFYESNSNNCSIYFKIPEGKFSIIDVLRKPKAYLSEELKDIIIVYCDKNPSTMFANAVDDYEKSITHVFGIRTEIDQSIYIISNLISSALYECAEIKNGVCIPKHVLLDPIRNTKGEMLSNDKQINVLGYMGFKLLSNMGYLNSTLMNDIKMNPRFLNFYRELGFNSETLIEFFLTSCNKNILNDHAKLENFDLSDLTNTNNFDFSLEHIYKISGKFYKNLQLDQKTSLGYFYVNCQFRNSNELGTIDNFKRFIKEFESDFKVLSDPAVYFESFFTDPKINESKINFTLDVALFAKKIMEIVLKNKGEYALSHEDMELAMTESDVDPFQASEALRKIIFGDMPFKFNLSKSIWFLGEEISVRRMENFIEKIKSKNKEV